MSSLYDAEYKCKVCKRRYPSLTELKRHYSEKHGNVKKMFKCDVCDYSSERKADVTRHASNRHSTTNALAGPSTSAGEATSTVPHLKSPPRPQRKTDGPGWPMLSELLGTPHSEHGLPRTDDPQQRDVPPTPQVSPAKRPSTVDGEENALRVIKRAKEAADLNIAEENLSLRNNNLSERISTVVLPNGQIYVTVDKFEHKA